MKKRTAKTLCDSIVTRDGNGHLVIVGQAELQDYGGNVFARAVTARGLILGRRKWGRHLNLRWVPLNYKRRLTEEEELLCYWRSMI